MRASVAGGGVGEREQGGGAVKWRRRPELFPTFLPDRPNRHPMFLERRVYQGSSGRVYPLPLTDRVSETAEPLAWDSVWLENAHLRVQVLPELGGRIHALQDVATGADLIYRQEVIKPALVGLAGPWVSGGIEFNWPQHHRPGTFLPVEAVVEEHADGAVTVWCGDRDPLSGLRAVHGVRLSPGRAVLEVVVRAVNGTPFPQTFLWWANVAVEAHEAYQSFFPPDVTEVADHAKRAVSTFPRCRGRYYGVDYAARARSGKATVVAGAGGLEVERSPDDLSFYANIPVPTSYMVVRSTGDFLGGYDHRAGVGIVHVADRHEVPGKKQWTWGDHRFGHAWDRHLTEPDATGRHRPYLELMAGAFTDNQPDFSFLLAGETRSWSHHWYPIHGIGPVTAATPEAALAVRWSEAEGLRIGVVVTRERNRVEVEAVREGKEPVQRVAAVAPGRPWSVVVPGAGGPVESWEVTVRDAGGVELVSWRPGRAGVGGGLEPAAEPAPPEAIAGADELYRTGLHLWQYRHATRSPVPYWEEAVRRDPGDARARAALGRWHLDRAEWGVAETHLRAAVARETRLNPNPPDGEAHLLLARVLQISAEDPSTGATEEARTAMRAEAEVMFGKAAWNLACAAEAMTGRAELAARRGDWAEAGRLLSRVVEAQPLHLAARNLLVEALRRCGAGDRAAEVLAGTRRAFPLDPWSRWLEAGAVPVDDPTRLDLVHAWVRCGMDVEALAVLEARPPVVPEGRPPDASWGAAPLVAYTEAWLCHRLGREAEARERLRRAREEPRDYCFPARLEEAGLLVWASRMDPRDPVAPFLLGNLLYDKRRHREALAAWRAAVRLDPGDAVAWRNAGIAEFNVLARPAAARVAFARARRADPSDARVLFEQDQLWKRTGVAVRRRLRELEKNRDLVAKRDDLTVELVSLLNQEGRHAEADRVLRSRRFQPWEGGEGRVLAEFTRAALALAVAQRRAGGVAAARARLEEALLPPDSLGEAWHFLANTAEVDLELGRACRGQGDVAAAERHLRRAATAAGDFRDMAVAAVSDVTWASAEAWRELGALEKAEALYRDLLDHARDLARRRARIDYFATSLPNLLLFEDDLDARQRRVARVLEAQALAGLGRRASARAAVREVLAADPANAPARDLERRLEGLARAPGGRAGRPQRAAVRQRR